MTIPEIVAELEAFGLPIPGRSSKTISDALRWEVRKGRVVRLERSRYQTGSMPRSTEWWIRTQVVAYRDLSLRYRQQRRDPAPSSTQNGTSTAPDKDVGSDRIEAADRLLWVGKRLAANAPAKSSSEVMGER